MKIKSKIQIKKLLKLEFAVRFKQNFKQIYILTCAHKFKFDNFYKVYLFPVDTTGSALWVKLTCALVYFFK